MPCQPGRTWVHILRAAKIRGYCRASGEELQTETSGPLRRAGQTRQCPVRRWWGRSESKPLSWQFDDVAQLYDEVWPRYPEDIIEHIIAFAALPAHARVFEVGCGTGQMTLPFAQRGYTVVALDHGVRLAALAVQHCQPYPQVRIMPCAIEAWQDTPKTYNLFLSAQAFHWLDPTYGFARAAELLKTGGLSPWSGQWIGRKKARFGGRLRPYMISIIHRPLAAICR